MASRSTRNTSRTLQRTPSPTPTPTVQSSPRTARKSMGTQNGTITRQNVNVSTTSSSLPVQGSPRTAKKSTSPRIPARTRLRANRTPSPTPTTSLQSSPRTARKSMGTQRSTITTQSRPAQNATGKRALVTGGGPSGSKQTGRARAVSNDSSLVNTQNTTANTSRRQSSSDDEDIRNSSKRKQLRKRSQRLESNSEGSDVDIPPTNIAEKRPVSIPSGSRTSNKTPTQDGSRNAKARRLSSSQVYDVAGSSTNQVSNNLVNKCVYYILVADQKKHAIRRADIVKNVFENQKTKEVYSSVLKKANDVLKTTFGLELLELTNQKNSYILINILDPDNGIREFAEYSPEELQKRGLIFLLLTIIFMNGNDIKEDKLWKALEPLGLDPNAVPHPVFGSIKKYITSELVKEMYLEYICVNKDPIQYEFKWGERAFQEVQKKDLLEFACEMMGDTKPEDWKLQFRDDKGYE